MLVSLHQITPDMATTLVADPVVLNHFNLEGIKKKLLFSFILSLKKLYIRMKILNFKIGLLNFLTH